MKGYLYAVLSSIFLATIGIFTKLIGSAINPISLTFYRVFLASIFILFFAYFRKELYLLKLKRQDYKPFFILGLLIALNFTMYITAFTLAPIANVILLTYVFPFVVYFLAYLFLKEKISLNSIIALFVLLGGILLINRGFYFGGYFIGNALALTGGILYGVFIVYLKYEERSHRSIDVAFWSMFIASLLLFPFAVYNGFGNFDLTISLLVLLSGIVSTGLAYIFFARALEHIRSHIITIIIILVESLTAISLAYLILNEALTKNVIMGGVLILFAAFLIQKEEHKKRLKIGK